MDPTARIDLNAKKKRSPTMKRKLKTCSPGMHRRKTSPRRCKSPARSKRTGRFIKQR